MGNIISNNIQNSERIMSLSLEYKYQKNKSLENIVLEYSVLSKVTGFILFTFGLYLYFRNIGHPYQFYGLSMIFSKIVSEAFLDFTLVHLNILKFLIPLLQRQFYFLDSSQVESIIFWIVYSINRFSAVVYMITCFLINLDLYLVLTNPFYPVKMRTIRFWKIIIISSLIYLILMDVLKFY